MQGLKGLPSLPMTAGSAQGAWKHLVHTVLLVKLHALIVWADIAASCTHDKLDCIPAIWPPPKINLCSYGRVKDAPEKAQGTSIKDKIFSAALQRIASLIGNLQVGHSFVVFLSLHSPQMRCPSEHWKSFFSAGQISSKHTEQCSDSWISLCLFSKQFTGRFSGEWVAKGVLDMLCFLYFLFSPFPFLLWTCIKGLSPVFFCYSLCVIITIIIINLTTYKQKYIVTESRHSVDTYKHSFSGYIQTKIHRNWISSFSGYIQTFIQWIHTNKNTS